VRTPLLPVDAFLGADTMQGDYESRRSVAVERLRALVALPEVREALIVASPGLWQRLQAWLDNPKPDGIELAVARYLARMSLRCTPFGLFAGVSTGTIERTTQLRLAPRASYRAHTRIDMGYLARLTDRLTRDATIRAELRFRPNTSIFRLGDRLHYFEAREQARGRQYFLVAVDEDPPLRATLERARHGAKLHQLATALVDDEVTLAEASEYVDDLVRSQLLVGDLEPAITGTDPLADLLQQLERIPAAEATRQALGRLHADLVRLDACELNARSQLLAAIQSQLLELDPDANPSQLLQVDLTKPNDSLRLGADVVDEIQRAFALLHQLFATEPSDGLDAFRKAFRERYGDAELPLTEVLDEEHGIGFRASRSPAAEAQPLLQGLDVVPYADEERRAFGAVGRFLLQKLCDALAAGDDEIVLEDAEIERLRTARRPTNPQPPDAYSIMACVWEAADGARIALGGGGGPSGVRLLGRFTPLDEELDRRVREHLRAEEAVHPERIYFEIVHLPEGRLGNVLCRTVLREHELSLLGRSGADAGKQIELSDLRISLRGERIVLRSERFQREVVPRLTSAHNTTWRSVGIYRFLAALQHQGVQSGSRWQWGVLDDAPTLPRVRYRNTILAPRRWNVRGRDLESLRHVTPPEFFDGFRSWARKRRLPRTFALIESDRSLPVDIENPLSVEAFRDLIARRAGFRLEELLPPTDVCSVRGPEGGFVHELVLPFVRREPAQIEFAPRPLAVRAGRQQLGSEWFYAKLYCGKAAADALLVDVLAPLHRVCQAEGQIERWFFIRYNDPHFHLRLRSHGHPQNLIGGYQARLLAALQPHLTSGRIWQLQIDCYEQEIDRYGGPQAMALCEEIFAADSEAVTECLASLQPTVGPDWRWRILLRGMDTLVDDFDLDPLRRFELYEQLANTFRHEFQAEQQLKKQILQRFREKRPAVASALSRNGELPHEFRAAIESFARRSERVRPAAAALQRLAGRGELSRPLSSIVGSLLHMHANRMTRSAARAQETVLYSMLAAHYDSELARQGIKGERRRLLLGESSKELRSTAG
jgi:thiopeptide-type bacteriocin biosynthesis protein